MVLIKLLTASGFFIVLCMVQNLFFNQLCLIILKLLTLIGTSWFIGSRIARFIIINRILPRISSKDKAVLITGSASGFGQSTALRLNELGFYVFATCRGEKRQGAVDLLNEAKYPDKMKIISLDVTKENQVLDAVNTVKKILNEKNLILHAIVNNAGVIEVGGIEWAVNGPSAEDYERAMDVNCFGVIRVTRGFLPLLRESRGRVVNVSSIMSRTSYLGMNQYCVSKAASVKFTEGLHAESVRFGVTTVSIEPWFYKTPLLNTVTSSIREKWKKAEPDVKRDYGDESFESLIRLSIFTSDSPIFVDERSDDVIGTIEEAVTSISPEPVYRVITPTFGLLFWIIHDLLPYDLSLVVRRIQLWFFLKFLA